mmetsp:Transcript_34785/g.64726  ORF Transcript_34785/g.64726 Transcript_34785/m.64726 type:complete len:209 (-) Transcript_34785:302-928(-)
MDGSTGLCNRCCVSEEAVMTGTGHAPSSRMWSTKLRSAGCSPRTFSMIFWTESLEWMARNLGFCSSAASAMSLMSGSTTGRSSPAAVELSHSLWAFSRASLFLDRLLEATLYSLRRSPRRLCPSTPSSSFELPAAVLSSYSSSSKVALKLASRSSLNASCSFFNLPVLSLRAPKACRNSRSPTYLSKFKPSTKFIRSSASSSSNLSFS